MNRFITTEAVTANALCSRKAFFVIRGEPEGSPHDYERVVDERAAERRSQYLDELNDNGLPGFHGEDFQNVLNGGFDPARVVAAGDLVATCDALVRISADEGKNHTRYEPHLVVGTHTTSNEQKLALGYAGHVIGQTQRYRPPSGFLVPVGSRPIRVRLPSLYSKVASIVNSLRQFIKKPTADPPPLNLTHKCATCPFHSHCLQEAETIDHLTLLERMNPKLLQRYAKKGVFTVNQLSYLFRPRRRRKRSPAAQPSFNIELQALSIRTSKIYLHEPPTLEEQPVELYLDVEGIPDQDFHYLIGLLIKSHDSITMQSFWADTPEDEHRILQECVKAANAFPKAPIYHYGSYERRAFESAAKKHGIDCATFVDRLININSLIFGKIYFPTRSNRLKDLGAFVGASWSEPDPSGLRSIAWRYRWEDTGEDKYRDMLLSYNQEDCQAVHLLTREMHNLTSWANSRPDVDSPFISKTNTTEAGQVIHDTFDRILKSAHLKYQQKRIQICPDDRKSQREPQPRRRRSYSVQSFLSRRAGKVIQVPRKRKCQNCADQKLRRSRKVAEHALLDLSFTRSGCRKTVVKYVGNFAHCPICGYYYSPPVIKRLYGRLFGRNLRCWVTYLRVTLRLPVRVISQVIDAMFSERVSHSVVVDSVSLTASEYVVTEKLLLEKLIQGPVLHADETKINIRGVSHYAWVLTDGRRVVFKLSDTRQISPIKLLLAGYGGVLISDFYGGYDSLECNQQKCLVHLIRDLNNDLWKNPFNEDYECFVGTVRDLLVPIFEDVNRWGLKAHFLRKHMKAVDRFYTKVIEVAGVRSEPVEKYRKRFTRYRKSLFLFLTKDGIPWNNNMAERALRHLSVQQKISGCFVGAGASVYLRLLGVFQTCRFQDKPFLQFLLSGEIDVDRFNVRKRRRKTT